MNQPLNQQQLKRNKMIGETLERISQRGVMIGADIFKALLGFLKDMFKMVVGK